jgi:hypothetical protein
VSATDVTVAIPELTAVEVFGVAIPSSPRGFATGWHWAVVSLVGMEVVNHVTVEFTS